VLLLLLGRWDADAIEARLLGLLVVGSRDTPKDKRLTPESPAPLVVDAVDI
jgi:hypothetical protein